MIRTGWLPLLVVVAVVVPVESNVGGSVDAIRIWPPPKIRLARSCPRVSLSSYPTIPSKSSSHDDEDKEDCGDDDGSDDDDDGDDINKIFGSWT